MTGIPPHAVEACLAGAVRERHGAAARLGPLRVMEDGHAGLTYGFDVLNAVGAVQCGYILKLGPPGVPRRGSTDIHRQARLLRSLYGAGLPVPDVPWASPDETPLGAPWIVMDRLPGRSFVIWEPHASFGASPERVPALWRQAAAVLARLHRLDWRAALADWEAPTTLETEIRRWDRLLAHAPDPAWQSAGRALSRRLSETRPQEGPVGLVHGDFQPGNVLYRDGVLTGIIDWDLAAIAPQGTDLGWLLMMGDRAAWHDGWKPQAPLAPTELVEAYREAGGPALQDLAWYQAFAQFRMGAIAGLNVKLHRDGRRHDPIWERFAPSVTTLFQRAGQLLGNTRASDRSPA